MSHLRTFASTSLGELDLRAIKAETESRFLWLVYIPSGLRPHTA